jgi:hypothetical protein
MFAILVGIICTAQPVNLPQPRYSSAQTVFVSFLHPVASIQRCLVKSACPTSGQPAHVSARRHLLSYTAPTMLKNETQLSQHPKMDDGWLKMRQVPCLGHRTRRCPGWHSDTICAEATGRSRFHRSREQYSRPCNKSVRRVHGMRNRWRRRGESVVWQGGRRRGGFRKRKGIRTPVAFMCPSSAVV